MSTGELVPMLEAVRRLGISRLTLQRRIAERDIPVYRSALDKQLHLLREADIQSLTIPIQAPTRKEAIR